MSIFLFTDKFDTILNDVMIHRKHVSKIYPIVFNDVISLHDIEKNLWLYSIVHYNDLIFYLKNKTIPFFSNLIIPLIKTNSKRMKILFSLLNKNKDKFASNVYKKIFSILLIYYFHNKCVKFDYSYVNDPDKKLVEIENKNKHVLKKKKEHKDFNDNFYEDLYVFFDNIINTENISMNFVFNTSNKEKILPLLIEKRDLLLKLKNKNKTFVLYFYLDNIIIQNLESNVRKKYNNYINKISKFFISKYYNDLKNDYEESIEKNKNIKKNFNYIPSLTFMNVQKKVKEVKMPENKILIRFLDVNNDVNKRIISDICMKYCTNRVYKNFIDKISNLYTSIFEKDISLKNVEKKFEIDFEIEHLFSTIQKH